MAFFKICACGERIVFERILGYPDNCPACGRKLVDFQTYSEGDARTAALTRAAEQPDQPTNEEEPKSKEAGTQASGLALKLINGKEIMIPDEGCIIGRTETGAEELAEFPSVSRQHLRMMPKRNIGVIIEDISSYGTLVDGQRITKNSPVRVAAGSKITLCDLETVLVERNGADA